MKKDELSEIIDSVTRQVIEKNKANIEQQVRHAYKADTEDGKIGVMDAVIRSTGLCLTLLPSLSAAITARMLVTLGLIDLEDDE